MPMLVVLLLLVTNYFGSNTQAISDDGIVVPDLSSDPFVFMADRLPTSGGKVNYRYLPAVANGHLATIVYSDTIYINGIYNGRGRNSYRARIPSYHAIKMMPNDKTSPRRYTFNITNGLFRETITTSEVTVTYQTYAHMFFNRVLISDVQITRNQSQGLVTVDWQSLAGKSTTDFKLSTPTPYKTSGMYQNGSTVEAESPDTGVVSVHLYWTPYPKQFILPAKDNSTRYCFVLSIDQNQAVSQDNFNAVIALSSSGKCQDLLDNHTLLWQHIWTEGQIDIDYEKPSAELLHLKKVILSSQFYLYSNLPSSSTFRPNNQFYGLSPGGLSTGTNGSDYYGHVFWDMETWMYPPILMFRPDFAKEMLSYRIHTMDAAFKNANTTGYKGIRYPWESAYSGYEVSPSDECGTYEQHITGDIAFAARQYVSLTRDIKWLNDEQNINKRTGYDILLEAARFWISRVSPNKYKKFDINGVMPPDEEHSRVNNSIFTNAVAYDAVYFARYAACLAGRNTSDVPLEWEYIASNLTFTYNRQKKYHEEFEGFDKLNETGKLGKVKQADVVLLGYPLNLDIPTPVRTNDLQYYEALTDAFGPAMTWGMFSIGWLDMNNEQKAFDLFNRSYFPYVRQPFKIWTEVAGGLGAVNFQTGMGGFLQGVIFGYGGIRLKTESLYFMQPRLIPKATRLTFKHLKYLGTMFDYTIEADSIQLDVHSLGNIKLQLNATGTTSDLKLGTQMFPRNTFSISPAKASGCPLPPTSLPVNYRSPQ